MQTQIYHLSGQNVQQMTLIYTCIKTLDEAILEIVVPEEELISL